MTADLAVAIGGAVGILAVGVWGVVKLVVVRFELRVAERLMELEKNCMQCRSSIELTTINGRKPK